MDPNTPPPIATPPVQANPGFRCASCGYDLVGVRIGDRCPECGTQIMQVGTTQMSSGKAITSMVLGIVSIPTCFMYGIPAIVCGILAIMFAKKADLAIQAGIAPVTSANMAKAGRVCGIIGLCLGVLYLVMIVGFIVFAIINS